MRRILMMLFAMALSLTVAISAYAHPGRTDDNGGHYDRSTDEYHYHHGYGEHQHKDMDGDGVMDCPYEFDDKTNSNATPQYTIDPKLLEDMEEWRQKTQQYTYPNEYSKTNDTKGNEQKNTLKISMSNNSDDSSPETNFDWYSIPFFIICISAFSMLFSPVLDCLKPGLTECVFELSLKAIVFSLPFVFLFDLLFMIFE